MSTDNTMGKISKLKFNSYKSDQFEPPAIAEFAVQFNPKTLGVDYAITYTEGQGPSDKITFAKAKPTDITIEFTLDGTGIDVLKESDRTVVQDEVKKFIEMCKEVDASTHEPPFIEISYGSILYKTRFKSCNITYTLFKSDGTPLRAVVKAIFLNIKNNVTDERYKSMNSPDVTHRRNIEVHQSIISAANKIYNRNDLYTQVAAANNLDTFRKRSLKENQAIYFPPIKK